MPGARGGKAGERTVLTEAARGHWVAEVTRAFTVLEDAHKSSVLPEEPTNRQELEDWLIALRRSQL
jgi:hypothetical protein